MEIFPTRVSADPESVLLHLDLRFAHLPERATIGGTEWVVKDEFHVTMLSRSHGIKSARYLRPAIAKAKFSVKFIPMLLRISKLYEGEGPVARESIILLCEVGGSDVFYGELNKHPETLIPPVSHHVTLFTLDNATSRRGIGLPTFDDLMKFSRPIDTEAMPASVIDALRAFK